MRAIKFHFMAMCIATTACGLAYGGSFAALNPRGLQGDDRHSIIYDARTGDLVLQVPVGKELSSINIDSAAGIFTGISSPDFSCGGTDCGPTEHNIFKSTFSGTFGSLSIGPIATRGLSEEVVLSDLTAVGLMGALNSGPIQLDSGRFDLIYVPISEPQSIALVLLGLMSLGVFRFSTPE